MFSTEQNGKVSLEHFPERVTGPAVGNVRIVAADNHSGFRADVAVLTHKGVVRDAGKNFSIFYDLLHGRDCFENVKASRTEIALAFGGRGRYE